MMTIYRSCEGQTRIMDDTFVFDNIFGGGDGWPAHGRQTFPIHSIRKEYSPTNRVGCGLGCHSQGEHTLTHDLR